MILLGHQLKYKARRDHEEGEGIMPIDGDPPKAKLVTGVELGRQVLGPIEDHVVLGPGRAVSVSVSSCVSIAYHRVSVVLCDGVQEEMVCVGCWPTDKSGCHVWQDILSTGSPQVPVGDHV